MDEPTLGWYLDKTKIGWTPKELLRVRPKKKKKKKEGDRDKIVNIQSLERHESSDKKCILNTKDKWK